MHTSRKWFSLLIPLVLMLACGAPTAVVPPAVAPTAVPATAAATFGVQAVTIASATPAPVQGLSASGPYFAYLRLAGSGEELVVMDDGGPGKKIISLPAAVVDPDAQNGLQTQQISPDGKWLSFYTGSAGSCDDPASVPGTNDLRLNLVDLSTGAVDKIADLLPANYPQNFAANAQALTASGADTQGLDAASLASALTGAFLCGIHASAWSPNGRYLAFAGAMDGPSSDTYLADLQTQKITRLSSGPEEVQWLQWSPDGQWILQGGTWAVGEGMSYDIYASSVDGVTVKMLSNSTSGIAAWLNATTYLEYDSANGPGAHDLRSVDVRSGSVQTLWKASFAAYALDQADGLLAVSGIPDPATWTGSLYLIKTASGAQQKIQDGVWNVQTLGKGGDAFLVEDTDSKAVALLTAGGKLVPTQAAYGTALPLDKQFLVPVSGNQLGVYSVAGDPQGTLDLPVPADAALDDFKWYGGGSGFLLGLYTGDPTAVSGYWLVALDAQAGTAALVDQGTTRPGALQMIQTAP